MNMKKYFFCQTANDMWKCLSNLHYEKFKLEETFERKVVVNESIVDRYLVETNTCTTSSNSLCEGNVAESSTSHLDNNQEDCTGERCKMESSDDNESSSESEDEEYAKVVKEFKKLIKRRPMAYRKRKAFLSKRSDEEKDMCFVAQASDVLCLGIDLEPDE